MAFIKFQFWLRKIEIKKWALSWVERARFVRLVARRSILELEKIIICGKKIVKKTSHASLIFPKIIFFKSFFLYLRTLESPNYSCGRDLQGLSIFSNFPFSRIFFILPFLEKFKFIFYNFFPFSPSFSHTHRFCRQGKHGEKKCEKKKRKIKYFEKWRFLAKMKKKNEFFSKNSLIWLLSRKMSFPLFEVNQPAGDGPGTDYNFSFRFF